MSEGTDVVLFNPHRFAFYSALGFLCVTCFIVCLTIWHQQSMIYRSQLFHWHSEFSCIAFSHSGLCAFRGLAGSGLVTKRGCSTLRVCAIPEVGELFQLLSERWSLHCYFLCRMLPQICSESGMKVELVLPTGFGFKFSRPWSVLRPKKKLGTEANRG